MDSESIRERVRQMIETGNLPCETGKVWAGRGGGDTCVVCVKPIAVEQVEFEVVLRSGEAIRLHPHCHRIWTEECEPATGLAGRG